MTRWFFIDYDDTGRGGITPQEGLKMDTIRIRITNRAMHEVDHEPVGTEMFYDPHCRHWVIYPVDAEWNQLCEAVYGFGKSEAKQIRAEMEESIKAGTIDRTYFYYD